MEMTKRWRGSDLPIWNFFKRINDGNRIAFCNYCRKKFSFKTSITNLKTHLRIKHNSAYNIYLDESEQHESKSVSVSNIPLLYETEETRVKNVANENGTARSSGGGRLKRTNKKFFVIQPSRKVQRVAQGHNRKSDENKIDLSLLKMLVYDLQPLSLVNDVGFRAYTHALNSKYEIPERKTLTANLLPEVYGIRLAEIKKLVQEHAKSVCISVECWTSRHMDSHMGITAHFMTEDPIELKSVMIHCSEYDSQYDGVEMYIEIKNILETWGIYKNVNFLVTNNTTNLKSAAKFFESDGWSHFGCFAHKLNQVVQDALCEVKETITKVQKVVNHLRNNTGAIEEILKYQREQNAMKPKTVIESVPTRWNSVYLMLERFVELAESLRETIPNLDADLPIISMEEWKCIEQMCVILKPFYEATVEMSGETYLAASKACILTSSLTKICENYTRLQDLSHPVKQIIQKLKDGMTNRLGDIEQNDTISLSTILDPRFKLKAVKSKERIEHLKTILKKKIIHEKTNKGQLAIKTEEQVEAVPSTSTADFMQSVTLGCDMPSYSLWCEFDTEASKECLPKTSDDEAAEELEKYLAENLVNRTDCSLKYWREHKFIYPGLFKLFMKHCNVMATSIPCDSLFSESGYILNDRRAQLPSTKLSQIMFLHVNKI